jgi:hypothetical protein
MTEPESPLKTEPESAKYLRISARGLWGLRNDRKIGYVKVGSKVFYTKSQLDEYITQNLRAPAEQTGPPIAA